MDKIYLVKYEGGDYDSRYENIIFATYNKKVATKYVTRFNRILKKWKQYYSQFETSEHGFPWIRKEYIDLHFYRWDSLRNVSRCYWKEIEVRQY